METYTTKSGAKQYKPALSWLLGEIENDNSTGFCLACGEEANGVEPDARKYRCESCDAPKVYGCEELMLMGLYYEDQDQKDNRTSHDYGEISPRE